MLNSSKKFVKYLDNYDKVHQKNYDSLLYHIRNEFNNYYKDTDDIDPELFLINSPRKLQRVRSFEKGKKLFEKEVTKEKVDINDSIDNIQDLIEITEKYSLESSKQYNIDLEAIKKIKPDLIELNKFIGIGKLKQNVCVL